MYYLVKWNNKDKIQYFKYKKTKKAAVNFANEIIKNDDVKEAVVEKIFETKSYKVNDTIYIVSQKKED